MKLRTITVASVAVAAALTLSACSSDDGGNSSTTTTTTAAATTTTQATAAGTPLPSVEELNGMLGRAFDPAVPVEEKTQLVQGGEEDPTIIEQVANAAAQSGAKITVLDINDNGDGTATAGIETDINGQVQVGTVEFVDEQGVWKLSRENACSIVQIAGLQSTACP